MTTLPPELAVFASILDAQSAPVRDAFNYCLCLLMVEPGEMRLEKKLPASPSPAAVQGERGGVCVCNHKRGPLQRDGAEDEQGVEGGAD